MRSLRASAAQQALDREAEVGQQERIVEMIDRRRQEAGRRLRRVDAALAQQAGDDRRDVERRGQRRDVRVAIARVGTAGPVAVSAQTTGSQRRVRIGR